MLTKFEHQPRRLSGNPPLAKETQALISAAPSFIRLCLIARENEPRMADLARLLVKPDSLASLCLDPLPKWATGPVGSYIAGNCIAAGLLSGFIEKDRTESTKLIDAMAFIRNGYDQISFGEKIALDQKVPPRLVEGFSQDSAGRESAVYFLEIAGARRNPTPNDVDVSVLIKNICTTGHAIRTLFSDSLPRALTLSSSLLGDEPESSRVFYELRLLQMAGQRSFDQFVGLAAPLETQKDLRLEVKSWLKLEKLLREGPQATDPSASEIKEYLWRAGVSLDSSVKDFIDNRFRKKAT